MSDPAYVVPPHVVLGPTLKTARLILRPPAVEDFPRWAELMADEYAARFIGGVQAKSQVWRTLCSVAGMWALTGEGMFSIIEKSSGLWVGRIGPLHPYGWPGREVGWSLHRDATGKGYAVEAAAETLDYAFDVLGWDDVIHCIDPDNHASARVATRLGSVNRGPGVLPEPHQNSKADLWGQTRVEWAVNRTRLTG